MSAAPLTERTCHLRSAAVRVARAIRRPIASETGDDRWRGNPPPPIESPRTTFDHAPCDRLSRFCVVNVARLRLQTSAGRGLGTLLGQPVRGVDHCMLYAIPALT